MAWHLKQGVISNRNFRTKEFKLSLAYSILNQQVSFLLTQRKSSVNRFLFFFFLSFLFFFSFLFSFIFLSFFLLFFKFYVCIFYLCVRYMQYSTCVYTCPQVYMDNLLLLRTPGDKQVTSKPPRSSCLRNTVITDILINMWLFNGRLGDSNSGSCVCAASTTEPSPRLQTGSFLICYFYGIPER